MTDMRALAVTSYGPAASSLRLLTVPKPALSPAPKCADLLIRVHSVGIAPGEYMFLLGTLRFLGVFPLPDRLGCDYSGVVEALGEGAAKEGWNVGDEVVGFLRMAVKGSIADYITAPCSDCARKPKNITHDEASCLPSNGLTAYQSMLRHAGATDVVFVTGGLGGVGHLVLQLAKNHFGFKKVITSVSTAKVARVKAEFPWVDEVIDYKTTSPLTVLSKHSVDLIYSTLGKPAPFLPYLATARPAPSLIEVTTLSSSATLSRNTGLQFPWYVRVLLDAAAWWTNPRAPRGARYLPHNTNQDGGQMGELMRLVEQGKVRALVAKVFKLEEAAEAFELANSGVVGKVVIRVAD